MAVTGLSNKMVQTKMLLSKGIVAAEEYTQRVQQQRNQALQVEAGQQDLDATLARGNAENVEVAELELMNVQAKVQDLRNDLAHATVLAPVSGVVLQPADLNGGKHASTIVVGSRLTRGQTIFTIGDLESFLVRAKIDEIDINKIHVGQKATIIGDDFDDMSLNGIVTAVAAQAAGESTLHTGMSACRQTYQSRLASLLPKMR
jgi:HlyD family secretion protein